jgi:hypothetical protein
VLTIGCIRDQWHTWYIGAGGDLDGVRFGLGCDWGEALTEWRL